MSARLKADGLLFLTSLIWGSAFVAQRVGALELGVYIFNAARFFIGALILLGIVVVITRRGHRNPGTTQNCWDRDIGKYAVFAGGVLFVGSGLQQAGLKYTTAGNAGFITGLYVVIVPFLVRMTGRGVGLFSWIAAAMAVVGLALLSLGDSLFSGAAPRVNVGDLLELGGAFFWAAHVLIVGYAMRSGPAHTAVLTPLVFSAIQFLTAGSIHLITGLAFEIAHISWSPLAYWAIAYVAVFSTAIGYTLQVFGQRHAPETDAALILSFEAVFAAFFGFLILTEVLQPVQIIGCAVIFCAIVLAQLKKTTRA